MGLTVTEDTPVDMLAGSMEILVQMPRDHHLHTQRVTVSRSTPMMDLLVQIATAHKLPASSYTLQAIGERGLILPHHPNTPIGALDVLQVKLLPKQSTCVPRKTKQSNQPFETTFRLQVHMPRNQLYVSRVSPKMNLGKILDEVCREKNLDRNKYELRHPANLEETLDLSLSLQDYHLQEVTLYAKQTGILRPTLSTQDIMALQRQEERHRQQTKQSVFGFMFKKSKESSLSTDSLAGRSASPARSDETARSASPLQPPARPQRKKRPAPKPPTDAVPSAQDASGGKDKTVINHSRNSSDSSGYHEASVLSDNLADSAARLPETLPRRSKAPAMSDVTRKLAQTSQSSKSLGNLTATGATLSRGISNTSLNSTGLRKKRAAPPPPAPRPLSSAISTQALERIVDSEESLTSDMDPSKPPSDIGAPSKANSDIDCPKANSDIGVSTQAICQLDCKPKPRAATRESDGIVVGQNIATKTNIKACSRSNSVTSVFPKTDAEAIPPVEAAPRVEQARVATKKATDAIQDIPSETEILLQKVSDTLSCVLPTRPETSSPIETNYKSASVQTSDAVIPECSAIKTELVGIKDESSDMYRSCIEFPMENTLNASTPNMTATDSQQDTSDYVSAMGEDLSISDWEYQLPAPPSAFRDSSSPVALDDYDTVTQKSAKEPVASPASKPADATDSSDKNVESATKVARATFSEWTNSTSEAKIEQSTANKQPVVSKQTACAVSHKPTVNSDLRKDVISELENKIEHGALAQNVAAKDFDRRSNLAAPKIAPVDNTLSNFTITTYTKEKSLDIFEELEESNARNSDKRFLKTFATLSRSNDSRDKENATGTTAHLTNGISFDKKTAIKSEEEFNNCKTEPKTRNQNAEHRWQLHNASNEKTNIQRSKSYISMSNNSRYQAEVQEINERKPQIEIADMKKATSITDLNADVSRNSRDEKFSQYRNGILRHEESTKEEKQLQSLQVLKSILPQLKNAQQSEENTSKEYSNALSNEKTRYESNEHSNRTSVSSTHESRDAELEYKELLRKENAKRYTYTGPPAISLGSWSERPSVNVQIKMDTDYKLGTNNARTIVNITDFKNRKDVTNYVSRNKSLMNKKPDEPVKKLVTHTTSNFQIPLSNRVDASKIEDRPVVMGVELKKSSIETNYPRETSRISENEIDGTLNFQELKKTFGQQVNLRQKPKRININRQSADCDMQSDGMEKIADAKQNGYAKFARSFDQSDISFKSQSLPHGIQQQNSRAKKFTSVKDINGTSQNIGSQNETSFRYNVNNGVKINPPMPVVKGFKIPTVDFKANNNQINYNHNRTSTIDSASRNAQAPKPVTTPVITGVTLKSVNARPYSMPVQLDSRDMLLESIRNFGGREKLKSTAERY